MTAPYTKISVLVNFNSRLWLFAAECGDEVMVKLLLEKGGVDINSKDMEGRTVLSLAAGSGHEAVVKLLLEQCDVDVNSRDNEGRTPLLFAAGVGHEAIAQMLLEKGGVC
jgi:ankyrin repeat protein